MSGGGLDAQHPVVMLLPFLPLEAPVTFGGWWLGPLSEYSGEWASADLEAATRTIASRFSAGDHQLDHPSLLARLDLGVDGLIPSAEAIEALRPAIGFATIDQNPYWSEVTSTQSYCVATADNADLWVQPIDLHEHRITLGSGGRVQTLAGGLHFSSESFHIQAPLELHMPFPIQLDAEALHALYTTLVEPRPGFEDLSARIRVAVRWLLRSWMNTPSITWQDRLIFIKVATEALTRCHRNDKSAAELVRLYSRAMTQDGEGVGIDGLLWSPGEPRMTRHWTNKDGSQGSEVTQLEHWACALGETRNALVHGEDGASLTYAEPSSPYSGPFVEIGDRVVRELITVLLGECGYPECWRRGMTRAGFRAWQRLVGDNGTDGA